jgi:hypothetical protein
MGECEARIANVFDCSEKLGLQTSADTTLVLTAVPDRANAAKAIGSLPRPVGRTQNQQQNAIQLERLFS